MINKIINKCYDIDNSFYLNGPIELSYYELTYLTKNKRILFLSDEHVKLASACSNQNNSNNKYTINNSVDVDKLIFYLMSKYTGNRILDVFMEGFHKFTLKYKLHVGGSHLKVNKISDENEKYLILKLRTLLNKNKSLNMHIHNFDLGYSVGYTTDEYSEIRQFHVMTIFKLGSWKERVFNKKKFFSHINNFLSVYMTYYRIFIGESNDYDLMKTFIDYYINFNSAENERNSQQMIQFIKFSANKIQKQLNDVNDVTTRREILDYFINKMRRELLECLNQYGINKKNHSNKHFFIKPQMVKEFMGCN